MLKEYKVEIDILVDEKDEQWVKTAHPAAALSPMNLGTEARYSMRCDLVYRFVTIR